MLVFVLWEPQRAWQGWEGYREGQLCMGGHPFKEMGWFKLFHLEKALMGGDFVTAVTGTELNCRTILCCRRQGAPPELAEVREVLVHTVGQGIVELIGTGCSKCQNKNVFSK